MMKKTAITTALLFLLSTTAALGQSDFQQELNQKNIKQFLEEMKRLTVTNPDEKDPDDLRSYLDKHVSKKSIFKSKTTYEIPGYPIQEKELKLEKAEFIDSILDDKDTLKNYDHELTIIEINISRSGKSAKLKTSSTETGKLLWPNKYGELEEIPIEGSSECDQSLRISPKNYIQMVKADCVTSIVFSPFLGEPLGE